MKRQLQTATADPQQPHCNGHVPTRRLDRGQSDVLRPGEFRARLGLGRTRFHELQQQGKFRALVSINVSAARGTTVYSRKKVEAWIEQSVIELVSKRSA